MPDQRPRCFARLLQFPGRALEASAHNEPRREHIRDRPPPDGTLEEGCLSNKTALAMVFKLAQAAEKHWRRLDGQSQLPKVILGVKFTDGIEVAKEQVQTAA